jgi:hypothetical protein
VSARRLIALAAALALALFVAACGGDSGGGSSSSDGKSATQLLQAASKKPAKSADMKLSFEADVKGSSDLKGPIKLNLEGPYKSNGTGALPDLDWKVKAEGDGKSFEARLISMKDNAWVEYQGTTYEVGTQLVGKLNQQLKQNQSKQQQSIQRLGINPANIIKNAKVEDGEAGGVDTNHVSGDIDVPKLLELVNKLIKSPSVNSQLPPGAATQSLSPQTIADIDQAVKEAHVEADVGKSDGILRKSAMDMSFDVPEDKRSRVDNVEGGSFKFSLEQSDVNGGQSVTAPTGARPITELLQRLGIPPQLLQGPGFTTPSPG